MFFINKKKSLLHYRGNSPNRPWMKRGGHDGTLDPARPIKGLW